MKVDDSEDFGFGFVTEEEVAARELQRHADAAKIIVADTTKAGVQALYGLRDLYKPLLNNLAKDSNKAYVYWPDRVTKLNEFIKKVDAYIVSEVDKLNKG